MSEIVVRPPHATAFAKVFADCQKIIAVVLEFDEEIAVAMLAADTFNVFDKFETALYPAQATRVNGGVVYSERTVIKAYTATAPESFEAAKQGRFVILELSPDDEAAPRLYLTGEHRACVAHVKNVCLRITQQKEILSAVGARIKLKQPILCTEVVDSVTDRFIKGEYRGLQYSLFIPEHYNCAKKYPLVQFIADSWGVGDECEISLIQGLGGPIWALPSEQAKHECFVLCPQFPWPTIVEDDYSASPYLEKAKDLLDHIIRTFSIDDRRVYHTGQSMGFLAGCELNVRYPELFAANLLISGFWNPEKLERLYNKDIWFFVSRDDRHSFDVLDQAVDRMEAAGAKVGRYNWNGREDLSTLNEKAKLAAADANNIKYVLFDEGTVATESCTNSHRATWQLVYQLEAVRDWLFTKAKDAMISER